MFKASEVEITDKGLAFVCDSEAEAQRAYWEGQLRERKVKLDGNKRSYVSSSRGCRR